MTPYTKFFYLHFRRRFGFWNKNKNFFFLRKNIFFISAQIAPIGLKIVSIVMKSKVTPEKVVYLTSSPTSCPHSIRKEDGQTSTRGCETYFFKFSKVSLVISLNIGNVGQTDIGQQGHRKKKNFFFFFQTYCSAYPLFLFRGYASRPAYCIIPVEGDSQ